MDDEDVFVSDLKADIETNSSSSISCHFDGSSSSRFSQQLVQKKNTTSQVWHYFGFDPDSNGRPKNCDTPKCKLCLVCVAAKWGNTSNLLNHLRKHHPEEYSSVVKSTEKHKHKSAQEDDDHCDSNQLTIQQSFNQTKKWNRYSKEHKKW